MNNATIIKVEDIAKGVANAKRVAVLLALARKSPLYIDEIQDNVPMHYKTLNMHLQRLHRSGLIAKEFKGPTIQIYITKRGKQILTFLRNLD
ncbi:MAG TPA: ArsR family transcriptional regulator [Candidatus Saccharimonadales bacterium]